MCGGGGGGGGGADSHDYLITNGGLSSQIGAYDGSKEYRLGVSLNAEMQGQ